MRDLILVAAGGALGATARHLAARAAILLTPATFPWGTFVINITGCLAMGVVAGLANAGSISPSARLFVATGLLGGYTTFSAFGLEAQGLLSDGRVGAVLAYVLGQVLLAMVGVILGLAIARRIG
ncbi:MAG: fluoride efflux transporter CrcB [Vicinamibacteria bacterium]|nr:fluoride efflux transporter CrcB [Vicinamibacteria bacterium]